MLRRLASYQSPLLYVRVIFWFGTILFSLLPFIAAETKLFSTMVFNPLQFYQTHYQGILAVFIVTIATAMFDMLSMVIFLTRNNSYIAAFATFILVTLALFMLAFGLALGGALMSLPIGTMHWGFLPLTALVCLIATTFVAILSSDYRPQREGEI